jgi:hypothetical protein
MLMTIIAIGAAVAASVTGIMAIGHGNRFDYSQEQLKAFDPLAIAYVWTCGSTLVSGLCAAILIDATVRGSGHDSTLQLLLSVASSVLFCVAHPTVGHWASKKRPSEKPSARNPKEFNQSTAP